MKWILVLSLVLSSCNAFNYGFTSNKTENRYNIVSNKNSFGYKRVKYNRGFHKTGPLGHFLKTRGNPDFIYEYRDGKKNAINLYYVHVDSAYMFKEMKANRAGTSASIICRKINAAEKLSFDSLLNALRKN